MVGYGTLYEWFVSSNLALWTLCWLHLLNLTTVSSLLSSIIIKVLFKSPLKPPASPSTHVSFQNILNCCMQSVVLACMLWPGMLKADKTWVESCLKSLPPLMIKKAPRQVFFSQPSMLFCPCHVTGNMNLRCMQPNVFILLGINKSLYHRMPPTCYHLLNSLSMRSCSAFH